jgi:hypothetical protein
MKFQKGHRYSVGNRGGRSLGYTYEKDQLVKLRQIIDRMLAKMDGIERGKITSPLAIERFKLFLPVALKAMDKLHPNKTQTDFNVTIKPIPLDDVHKDEVIQEDKDVQKALESGSGGDISLQNGVNHNVANSASPVR